MRWIWTCRGGFEPDLTEELGGELGGEGGARLVARAAGPALVTSDGRPTAWPVFARAGFPVAAEVSPVVPEAVSAALCAALDTTFAGKPRAWQLAAWVPDADATNPLSPRAEQLAEDVMKIVRAGREDLSRRAVDEGGDAVRYGGLQAQLCLTAPDRVLVGALPAGDLPCLAPGGRARVRMPKLSPSRAGRKLVEAFDWMGRAPEAGDLCVDLGAAPGGWTAVLLERRCQVVAVDPAELDKPLRGHKGLHHLKTNAFEFQPDEPVDWLLCDMAYRPLEVASLLGKWGRRKLARALVANIKLPMKQRLGFVQRVVKIVAEGGWQDVRARQLYHDREEITLTAWR